MKQCEQNIHTLHFNGPPQQSHSCICGQLIPETNYCNMFNSVSRLMGVGNTLLNLPTHFHCASYSLDGKESEWSDFYSDPLLLFQSREWEELAHHQVSGGVGRVGRFGVEPACIQPKSPDEHALDAEKNPNRLTISHRKTQ